MNPLRLEQMTVFDVEPAEVVGLAAALDVPFVSLWTTAGMEGARPVTAGNKRSVLQRLAETGVRVDTVEAFLLGGRAADVEAEVALAAELGASAIVAVNLSLGEDEAAAAFADLAALAGRYGLLANLEPISMGATRTAREGARVLEKAGAANGRLTIDLLHMMRTETPLSAIAALDPALIGSAQICDGPAQIAPEQLIDEAGYSRMAPGTGDFPVTDFIRALPPALIIGVEAPLKGLREQGVSALERSRLVIEATRGVQRRAQGGPA